MQQVMSHLSAIKKDMIVLEKSEFSTLRHDYEVIPANATWYYTSPGGNHTAIPRWMLCNYRIYDSGLTADQTKHCTTGNGYTEMSIYCSV